MIIDFNNKQIEGSNGRPTVFDCQIPESPKAVIVFAHGYKGYKDWGAWHLMQQFFVQQQFGFVKFNMSHNGGTVEKPIDFPDLEAFGKNRYTYEVNDLNRVVDEVDRMIRQELELTLPIYVIGHSRGGGVAVLAAAENPKISKLVTLAGISDIGSRFPTGDELADWKQTGVYFVKNGRTNQQMPHYFSFYTDFLEHEDGLNIQKATEKLVQPFLVVHGDMDLAVSISEGQIVAQWSEANEKFAGMEIIKGAGHTFGAKQPWTEAKLPEDLKIACNAMLLFFDN